MEEKKTSPKGKLLLKSYAMSLLSLMLCVTMLVGTTYAWFTSDVTTGANEIQVGTLKVDMTDTSGNTLRGATGLFGSDTVKWEPGATWVETVLVKNFGDLAFDYGLYFGAVTTDAQNVELIGKYIDVYVTSDDATATSLDQILNNWVRIGTLADVMKNNVLLTGGSWTENNTAEPKVIDKISIALHMPTTVTDTEIMGQKLTGFGLRLSATQKVLEQDAFGENYDQMASTQVLAGTYEELNSALLAGMDVRLTDNIEVNSNQTLQVKSGDTVVLDLNGYTISGNSYGTGGNRELFLVRGNLTVKGVKSGDTYTGGITYSHKAEDDMAWGAMSAIFDITAGGSLTLQDVKAVNNGGTAMNFVAHLNNWGSASLYADSCLLEANYIAVRAFNSGYDMNNVVLKNTTLKGKYALWVHNYLSDLAGQSAEAVDARLNLSSLYTGNNSIQAPVIYGYSETIYRAFDAASFAKAMEKNATKIVLEADVNVGDQQFTIPAGKSLTLELNGHDLTGAYTGADHYAMFTIEEGASVTVNGEGEVKANTEITEGNRSLAIFQNAGSLVINGGTYNMSNVANGKTWIIATIVDNRTKSASCDTKLEINGGDFSVSGEAKNLFRNYPQQGGTATLTIKGGKFHANGDAVTYIWNQESGSYPGYLNFLGGTYDAKVVYEDYNGQADVTIASGVVINAYSGNG